MSDKILLESGTNELEILLFELGGNFYGINVAKVTEIIPYQKPTSVPNAHSFVEGIYMPRDTIITAINLSKALGMNISDDIENHFYIVTNFNQLHVGFHVERICEIKRVSWAQITNPDSTIQNIGNGCATGIIKVDNKLVILLDFEKIVADINPETSLKIEDVNHMEGRKRNETPIMVVEDSHLLSKLIHDCLIKAGYTNIICKMNGAEAWQQLTEYKTQGNVNQMVSLIITDIEMPQMDGHHLVKLIKQDTKLSHIPVVIFSSLVNDDMRKKGQQVGADAQLSKPEIGLLIQTIDKLLNM